MAAADGEGAALMPWENAEFAIRDQGHRGRGSAERRIRSALAHFMLPGGRAACGYVPHERTRMLPEDLSTRGAFRCERCRETRR